MAATVQALRFHGKEDIRVEAIEPQPCGPNEVRLRIEFCGICGSDIHEYQAGPIFSPAIGTKHLHTGLELPVTLGHEMSGTIIEIGSEIKGLDLGQLCTVNPSVHDEHYRLEPCRSCLKGRTNLCKRWACYGYSAPGGGLADEIVVNIASLLPVPAGVSPEAAALSEPLAVACHMIRESGFVKGDTVLILGGGPIGLALLLLLKMEGASKVFLSELAPARAQKAREFGADLVLDPSAAPKSADQDVVLQNILELTEDGVDVAFDAIGIQATLNTAIAATRSGGTIFNVAIHEKPLSIHPNLLTLGEKRYTGGICYTKKDFEKVLEALASGNLPADKMITSIISLKDVVEGAFEELIKHKEDHVKILVKPGA
ncbi:hypothetical protein AAFC00_005666 [Neodothiora populina]|uniref:Enoyl reductase (ER) domain-containing protein n=1 Tax=Neodothiora populina TaxID=2781224 RepID=A0ABR3P5M1_9PEZI